VDDFTLGVLFVAERDDRGFASTRVGAEFRVDVSLDNLGDGLGLVYVQREEKKRESVIVTLFRGVGRSHQKEKNLMRKSFLRIAKPLFSPLLSLSF
jgi:hypothetical protein